jgi:sugar lactone lactonase YvrE
LPVTVRKATVLRIELSIADGKPPVITGQTIVANGFGQRADKDAFLVGPTGLALGPNDTLYVSDALGNQIVAIPDATTRTDSAGTGRTVTKDGLLKRPLALTTAPNGHLLAINALKGQVVEIDPVTGKQLYAQWIDADQAQSPPGNGDLFGIAMTPDGKGFYYVEDDVNTIMEGTR